MKKKARETHTTIATSVLAMLRAQLPNGVASSHPAIRDYTCEGAGQMQQLQLQRKQIIRHIDHATGKLRSFLRNNVKTIRGIIHQHVSRNKKTPA